jgi:hypothetical protein
VGRRGHSGFLFARENGILSARRHTNDILMLMLRIVLENTIAGIAEAYGISQSAL